MEALQKQMKALGVNIETQTAEEDGFDSILLTFPDGAKVHTTSAAEGGEDNWLEVYEE